MGVSVRKKDGAWYVFINHNGARKARRIGSSRAAAEKVKRAIESEIALGDFGLIDDTPVQLKSFGDYAKEWIDSYAALSCKPSTYIGYQKILCIYLMPRLGKIPLDEVTRADVKKLVTALIAKNLSRSTVRNAVSVVRGIYNQAIDDELVTANPAANLGRLTKTARKAEPKGVALTEQEVVKFLETARELRPESWVFFLVALRAGLRRSELVALKWSDVKFGESENDPNRCLLISRNYVLGQFTSTKSKKVRRVDMSKELRQTLMALKASQAGKKNPMDLVFLGPEGGLLDPDNLYHRFFRPVLAQSGIRKIRLHDLRHTFGSLLLQRGASLIYVKEQMGHSSIQVTADIYGHLVPGADVHFVDLLDQVLSNEGQKAQPATQLQLNENTHIA